MTPRIDATNYMTSALGRAMFSLSHEASAALEPSLFELVNVRASQINGCAYCIDVHTKDARGAGEIEQRLYALSAWRETPFVSERERSALEWTEALTRVADTHAPDEVFERVGAHFSEAELVALDMKIRRRTPCSRIAAMMSGTAPAISPRDLNDWPTPRVEMTAS